MMGSRVLSTSESKRNEQCNGNTQAKEWSVVDGNGEGCQIQDNIKNAAVVAAHQEKDGIYELSPEAKKVDKAAGGKLSQEFKNIQHLMDVGKVFVVTDVGNYSAVAIAGYGPRFTKDKEGLDEKMENARWGVGAGVRALRKRGATVIELDPGLDNQHDSTSEAAQLATWQFDEFKSPDDKPPSIEVKVLSGCSCERWGNGQLRGKAQNWARFLSDMPANKMTPAELANEALTKLCPLGVKVVAHNRAWIEAQGMEAFLAVARGSCEEPVFLECEWKHGDGPTVLVAAKGVTFDCGGICLKSHARMMENRGSMAGAAAALGAMLAVAESKMELNVTLVIPLCENMISGQCMKVGDVVRALNKLFIKIEDTDMEGRLMLADALVYGQAAHKPEIVIDIATLTHGIRLATGGGAFGAFTNDEELWNFLREAGEKSGDRPWRFPLWNYYHRRIVDDPSIDLRNRGSEEASPCLGAAFLQNFICCKWLHMDTTGVAKLVHEEPPYLSRRRMSGRPTRTLIRLLNNLAEKQKKEKLEKEKDKKPN